jgi:hypothetical protein
MKEENLQLDAELVEIEELEQKITADDDQWVASGSSSLRFKTNVKSLPGNLAKVRRLRPVSLDWKENGKHDIGLIAEEVEHVVPEVVAYEDNGVVKGLNYGRLTTLLMARFRSRKLGFASWRRRYRS